MEHNWMWVLPIVVALATTGMRLVKGKWKNAIGSGLIASVILMTLFLLLHRLTTEVGSIGSNLFFSDSLPPQMIADFGNSGAIAITVGVYFFYCLTTRKLRGYPV